MKFILGELRFEDMVAGAFFLILIFLVLNNWKGANALLSSTASATVSLTRTLQGR